MTDAPEPSESLRETVIEEHAYKFLAATALGVVLGATAVYHFTEDWSWVDSLYFSVVAVTTVGFGDLTPTTDGSKLFTVFYVVVGVALIGTYLNLALRRRSSRFARRHRQ